MKGNRPSCVLAGCPARLQSPPPFRSDAAHDQRAGVPEGYLGCPSRGVGRGRSAADERQTRASGCTSSVSAGGERTQLQSNSSDGGARLRRVCQQIRRIERGEIGRALLLVTHAGDALHVRRGRDLARLVQRADSPLRPRNPRSTARIARRGPAPPGGRRLPPAPVVSGSISDRTPWRARSCSARTARTQRALPRRDAPSKGARAGTPNGRTGSG
jgi:hypothetical protein